MSESLRNSQLQAAREATPSRRHPGRAMTRAELAELVAQHVWKQHGVEAPIDRKYLGRLERGEVRWPNARYRHALREILGVASDSDLGFSSANATRMAKELEPVNRRSFFRVAALGGVAIAGRDRMVAQISARTAVSPAELEAVASTVDRLEPSDASNGGGALLQLADDLYGQVTTWRNGGVNSLPVERELVRLQGDIGAWAGWLAYDAGDLPAARAYLSDTIVHARTSDLPDIEVRAMSYLVLLLNRTGRHHEALRCAQAGQRIAGPRAPRKVRALLYMREAASHAGLSDGNAYQVAAGRAYDSYHGAPTRPDPLWVAFVNEAELDGLRANHLAAMGHHGEAAKVFRTIADNPDPKYRRNATYYKAKLSASLLKQGDVPEASRVALDVLPEASRLRSNRVVVILDEVRAGMVARRSKHPLAEKFVYDYGKALPA